MFKNYLFVALRNLKKYKTFSFINIFGLAVGMAFALLIILFIRFELSFDRYHPDADRIYRVVKQLPPGHTHGGKTAINRVMPQFAARVQSEFPEVESAVRFILQRNRILTVDTRDFMEKEVHFADPEIFNFFSFELILGDPGTALANPASIILSEKKAKKYFGEMNPLGKTIQYGSQQVEVTGVFRDMPLNSHFLMDFVISFSSIGTFGIYDLNDYSNSFAATYIRLAEGVNPTEFEEKIPQIYQQYNDPEIQPGGRRYTKPYLQPLTKIHLYSHIDNEFSVNGSISNIYIYASIGFILLLIACINFMNLSTARSALRRKEVGVRKIVGAVRMQLIKQFYAESFVMILISLIIAVVTAVAILPAFSHFVERPLSFSILKNSGDMLSIIGVLLFAGLISGSYPALILSSYIPADIFRKKTSGTPGSFKFRNLLVVFQFTVSIILIISGLFTRYQLNYLSNIDVGYTKERIINVQVRDNNIITNLNAIKAELKDMPNILAVAASDMTPNNFQSEITPDWPGIPGDFGTFDIYIGFVDDEFVDVYGMSIKEGRNFSNDILSDTKSSFIFNESLVKTLGWENPLGREFRLWNGDIGKVVGVVKNFNFHSLHRGIDPLCLYYKENQPWVSKISIKIGDGDVTGTLASIQGIWKKYSPKYPFEYNFFDDVFDRAYKAEQRLGYIFRIFSLLTIGLSCLGLFGLAAFTVERRRKEISIRRVVGASFSNVFLSLSKEFTRWVFLAAIVAFPIAYGIMNRWLDNFQYRTDMTVMPFLIAGSAALVISLLTISWQTVRAARTNPIDSLRQE